MASRTSRILRLVTLILFGVTCGFLFVMLLLPISKVNHASADAALWETKPAAIATAPRAVTAAPVLRPVVAVIPHAVPALPPPAYEAASIDRVPATASDEEPSAFDVATNPFRYVGARVRWTCMVDQVPAPAFADARCGVSFLEDGVRTPSIEEMLNRAVSQLRRRATVVLTGNVEGLEHDEEIVFEGTVRRPLLGENTFGAVHYYPTIHVDRFLGKRITAD